MRWLTHVPTSQRLTPAARPWPRRQMWGVALLAGLLLLLAVPSVGVAQQPAAPLGRLRATLTGPEVVPDPGPADANARLVVDLYDDQVCWEITWAGLAPIAAHLYRGARGEVGPVVIGLFEVQAPLAGEGAREGCTGADLALLREISQQPARFYAQMRSQPNPDGAARGQLGRPGQLPHTGPVTLPAPAAQIALFVLLGAAWLVGPLVDRLRQRGHR